MEGMDDRMASLRALIGAPPPCALRGAGLLAWRRVAAGC